MATGNVGRAANGRFVPKGSADDVTIVIGMDASGVFSEADKLAVHLANLPTQAGKAGKGIESGLKPAAAAMQQLNRVSVASTGSLAAMGETLGALANASGTGRAKLLLLATGAGAALAAVGALAGVVAGAVANIDSLEQSLSRTDRTAMASHIATLRRVRDGYADLDSAAAKLQITLGAAFSGALAKGGSGLAYALDRTATAVDYLANGQIPGGDAIAREQAARQPTPGVDQLGRPYVSVDDLEGKTYGPETPSDVEMLRRRQDAEKAAADQAAKAAERAQAERAKRRQEEADLDATFAQIAQSQLKAEADAAAEAERAEIAKRQAAFQSYYDWRKQAAADAAAADIKATQDAASSAVQAAQERQQVNQAVYGALGQLSSSLFGLIQSNLDNEVAATAEARLEQFRQQQHAAEAQAAVAAALAIVQTLAQLGPVAGGIAAIGITAATGLQIAAIENQAPPDVYHVGGVLAPDEVAITRTNERQGVFTAQAADALGEQGLRDVTQTGRAAAQVINIYVVDDKGTRRAREFARPNHTVGQRAP